jgi:large subunit ribosomal protein L25
MPAEVILQAETGRPLGSRPTRRLRADGKIPGVIYGHGTDPVHIAVGARELRVALSGESGVNQLLSLSADGKTYLALAREMQRHPVRGTVTHVDFQIVRRDEVVATEVPLNLTGEAVEVQHGDGLVEQQLFTVHVRAKPADIPASLELDVSELTIGDSIRLADLDLPRGVTTDLDPETALVVAHPPRVQAAEEAEEEEGEEAAEGAAAAEAEAGGAAADASGADAEG